VIIKTPLFKNTKKERDSQPDYRFTGEAEVDGREEQVEIAAWLNEAKSGMKYMSLTIKTGDDAWKPEAKEPPPAPAQTAPADEGFKDEIPF